MTAKQRSPTEEKQATLSIYLSGWVPPSSAVFWEMTHTWCPPLGTCVGGAFPFPDVV